MDVLTISKQYANFRAGLPSGQNIIPGSTTTVAGNLAVNGFLAGQNLLIGSSSHNLNSSTGIVQLNGTLSGTILQLLNITIPVSDFAALDVTVGTSLDVYANISHRWWLGSFTAPQPVQDPKQNKTVAITRDGREILLDFVPRLPSTVEEAGREIAKPVSFRNFRRGALSRKKHPLSGKNTGTRTFSGRSTGSSYSYELHMYLSDTSVRVAVV